MSVSIGSLNFEKDGGALFYISIIKLSKVKVSKKVGFVLRARSKRCLVASDKKCLEG